MEILYLTVYLFLTFVSVLFLFLKYQFSYWKRRGVLHDSPSLFVGNLGGVGRTQHVRKPFRDCYRKYKGLTPFAGFYMFYRPTAVIIDLELVKCILIKDFNYFSDRGLYYNEKDDPLSANLFLVDGAKWKQLRAKLTPTFSSVKMKFMFSSVMQIAENLFTVLDNMVNRNSGSEIVEIKELFARYTTDVIGTCAFGLDCNSLNDPNAQFRSMGKKIFTDRRHSRTIFVLLQAFPEIGRRLHIKLSPDHISEFYIGIVKETVKYREANNIKRNDFLSILIDVKNEISDDPLHKSLTIEEIAAQAFIFFLAGFETTASTMGFLMYELAVNQNIQDKARKEIQQVLQNNNGELTFKSMHEMKYLDQIIHETLRMYSVATILTRKTVKDYRVSNTQHLLQKGTFVAIPIDAIHHDPDIYPNPERFDPERFSPEEMAKRPPIAWLPFGHGHRNCIGQRFGEMQARLGLALLLKNFKFSLSKEMKTPLELATSNSVLCSKGGIFLKVERF